MVSSIRYRVPPASSRATSNDLSTSALSRSSASARTTGPPDLVEAIIREAGEEALVQQDTILRVEPPLLFERTFGGDPGSVARWELQHDADGCRLTLTHTVPQEFDRAHLPRTLAGWHQLLEQLGDALEGAQLAWRKERWEELRDHYAAKL